MKHSLADFPRCCLDGPHWCERDAWRAGFEADLKARRRGYRRKAVEAMKAQNHLDAVKDDQRAWMITQIIGDEPPKEEPPK